MSGARDERLQAGRRVRQHVEVGRGRRAHGSRARIRIQLAHKITNPYKYTHISETLSQGVFLCDNFKIWYKDRPNPRLKHRVD